MNYKLKQEERDIELVKEEINNTTNNLRKFKFNKDNWAEDQIKNSTNSLPPNNSNFIIILFLKCF